MTEEELQRIIQPAIKQAVQETLSGLGFTVDDVHEMQSDMLYLRKVRTGSEFMAMRIKTSSLAVIIPTILYIMWESIKATIHK